MARVKKLDTPPQRWDWGSVSLNSSRFRYEKFARKVRGVLPPLKDRVRALGHSPPDADEQARALEIFSRLNTPNALPTALRNGENRKARTLLRESREFAQLTIAHPLLSMLILTPAAWGVWDRGVLTRRTLDYRIQLAEKVLAGEPLREVCKAAGVSWHLRGIVGSARVLTAANHALINRPRLLGARPNDAELDKWLWAIAWATPSCSSSRVPSTESLLWAGRHADKLLAHTRKGILVDVVSQLPDSLERLRQYLWKSQTGERNAFPPHRDWEATWRTLEAWEADKAAEHEARLSDKYREKMERRAQLERDHEIVQAIRAAPRAEKIAAHAEARRNTAVRHEESERAERERAIVKGEIFGVERDRALLEQRRYEHMRLIPDAIFAGGWSGWRIVVLRTYFDLTVEGLFMRHCMGRSDYWTVDPYRNRALVAASFRDPDGKPKISFDFLLPESTAGQYTLSRMRGRCNKKPPADSFLIKDWISFLNKVAPDRRAELAKGSPFDMRLADAETLM